MNENSLGSKLRFLLKDSAIYGLANALSKLTLLIALPVMTRYFSVADYGKIDAVTFFANLLLVFYVFGQDSSLIRYYYEYDSLNERKKVITGSLAIQILMGLILTPLLLVYSQELSLFYLGENSNWVIWLIIAQLPFSVLISLASNLLRIESRKFPFLLINLGSTFSYIFSVIIGILYFRISLEDVFIIFFVSKVIFGFLAYLAIRKWMTIHLDHSIIKSLLKFGTPFAVICLIGAFLPNLDRYFIIKYLNEDLLGTYAVGYKIAMILQLPIYAFEIAWIPFYMSIFKDKDSSKVYGSVSKIYSAFLLIVLTGLILLDDLIISIIASDKYDSASFVLVPLGFGLIIKSVGGVLGIGVELSKKSYLKIISYTSGLFVSILVTLFLVEDYQIIGVSLGFLMGYLVNIIVSTYLSLRNYPLKFEVLKISICFLSVFLLLSFSQIFYHNSIAFKLGILVFISFLIYQMLIKSELEIIRNKR